MIGGNFAIRQKIVDLKTQHLLYQYSATIDVNTNRTKGLAAPVPL